MGYVPLMDENVFTDGQIDHVLVQAFDEAESLKQDLGNECLADSLQQVSQRYELTSLLAEGAAKQVYRATDQLTGRQVAYARLKSDDAARIEDFLQEVRLSALMEHASIPSVYDMGFEADGTPFFVMKLYEGRDLHRVLEARQTERLGPLEERVSWTLNVFLKVCDAVSYAHAQGILHLDIKPSNIRLDQFGEVVVCDWGIARMVQDQNVSSEPGALTLPQQLLSRATLHGEIQGTPGYMAPEQINRRESCSRQTDIYGLGALLFSMMIGRPPRDLAGLSESDFPAELKAICAKSLAGDPDDRYRSVLALIDDVDKYRNGLVTLAENAGLAQILRKWVCRHRRRFVIAASLGVLLASGGVLFKYYQSRVAELSLQLDEKSDWYERQADEQADRLFEQAQELYFSAFSRFEYDIRNIEAAFSLVQRANRLGPNHPTFRGLLGALKVVQGDVRGARADFAFAGAGYEPQLAAVDAFLAQDVVDETDDQRQLRLIAEFQRVGWRRLRNHLVFKRIQELEGEPGLLAFSIEAMKIVNDLPEMRWRYDPERQELDLSGNPIRILSPLRKLRIRRLILKGCNLGAVELHNLQWIPLVYLDISGSGVKNLDSLFNQEIITLLVADNKLRKIEMIGSGTVEFLDVRNNRLQKNQLRLLSLFSALKTVRCTAAQADALRAALPSTVTLVLE